jgi:hypothetical protein
LIGFATVTAGGGGAPACCWRSLQLATEVAMANSTANFRAPCITENDATRLMEFMNACSECG